jgi:phage gp29-like protein
MVIDSIASGIRTLRAAWNDPEAKGTRNKDKVLTRIIQDAQRRSRQDIATWRKAMAMAENPVDPDRTALYQLYADVALDNHLSGVWEHGRKARTMAQAFRIVDWGTGTEDEDMTALFQEPWFYEYLNHILDSILWGHSLIEPDEVVPNMTVRGIDLVPRQYVMPERRAVKLNPSDRKGIDYTKFPMAIEVGGRTDLGLLMRAAPIMLYKKNAMMAWSEYTEIFGMPILVGRTSSQEQGDIDRMMSALRDLGTAARAVFQNGEEIDMKSDHRTDVYNVYNQLIERCNSELSKLIVGTTGTTDMSKGAKAQAEVHERTGDDVIMSDKRFIAGVVNEKLLPMLAKYGWALQGKRFEYVETRETDDLYKRTLGLAPFFELDAKWVQEQFGVMVTAPKEKTGATPSKMRMSLDKLYAEHTHEGH